MFGQIYLIFVGNSILDQTLCRPIFAESDEGFAKIDLQNTLHVNKQQQLNIPENVYS